MQALCHGGVLHAASRSTCIVNICEGTLEPGIAGCGVFLHPTRGGCGWRKGVPARGGAREAGQGGAGRGGVSVGPVVRLPVGSCSSVSAPDAPPAYWKFFSGLLELDGPPTEVSPSRTPTTLVVEHTSSR